MAVVVGPRRARPRPVLARLSASLRHRAHVPIRQAHPRVDDAIAVHAGAGRPLDLARVRGAHPAAPRSWPRRRPPASLGATPRSDATHACRVRRGFRRLRATIGTPASPPKRSRAGQDGPKGLEDPREPAIQRSRRRHELPAGFNCKLERAPIGSLTPSGGCSDLTGERSPGGR